MMIRLFAGVLVMAFLVPPQAGADVRAGTAVVDITPREWPLALRGSFFPKLATEAHDPLEVRCVVLDDGSTTIAMALVDSCMVHRDVLDPAKREASEATGIPVEHMLVSATHTHSAPSAAGKGTPQERAYRKLLHDGIVKAITSAAANRQAARVGWGGRPLPDEVFNRRWFLMAGSMPVNPFGSDGDQVKMNPGAGNKNLVKPAGPVDSELSVLYVEDAGKKPLAVFANYALHYVGNTSGQVSADYFGEFARLMPVRLGRPAGGFVAMMTNGTSGDINNINFREPRPRRAPFEQIGVVASKAADAATHAIRGIGSMSTEVPIAMRQREVALGHRQVSTKQLERAQEILAMNPEEQKELPRLAAIYARRTVSVAQLPAETKVLVQAIRIGDLAICTLPFEVLVEIGLELKEKSPAADTIVVELANGGYGYLPTPHQHSLGGYETWLGTSKVQVDASRVLTRHLLEMLGELFPE